MVRSVELVERLAARVGSQPDTLGDADCETLHGGLLGQPINTLTSFGYVAAGVWLLERTRRLPSDQRTAARLYGAFMALTGAGSVAYHGPQFAGAQLLHDLPIVGVLGIGVGVPVLRRLRGDPVVPVAPVVPVRPQVRRAPSQRMSLAVGLVAIAGLAFVGGRTDSPVCDPDSLVQLHGLWHLCTAAAATVWATALWPVAPSATMHRGVDG